MEWLWSKHHSSEEKPWIASLESFRSVTESIESMRLRGELSTLEIISSCHHNFIGFHMLVDETLSNFIVDFLNVVWMSSGCWCPSPLESWHLRNLVILIFKLECKFCKPRRRYRNISKKILGTIVSECEEFERDPWIALCRISTPTLLRGCFSMPLGFCPPREPRPSSLQDRPLAWFEFKNSYFDVDPKS